MSFEEYLVSKKIDAGLFQKFEPKLFGEWKTEFDQMHPNSFTVQKFYLINPVRRKYILKQVPVKPVSSHQTDQPDPAVGANQTTVSDRINEQKKTEGNTTSLSGDKPAVPKAARPVFKPKPKIN